LIKDGVLVVIHNDAKALYKTIVTGLAEIREILDKIIKQTQENTSK
jgi:hypothetical protein